MHHSTNRENLRQMTPEQDCNSPSNYEKDVMVVLIVGLTKGQHACSPGHRDFAILTCIGRRKSDPGLSAPLYLSDSIWHF